MFERGDLPITLLNEQLNGLRTYRIGKGEIAVLWVASKRLTQMTLVGGHRAIPGNVEDPKDLS